MRLSRLPLLLVVALALAAPDEVRAQDVPRHKPRVTDSNTSSTDDSGTPTPATKKKKRKHANSLDDEGNATDESPPPPPPKKRLSDDDDSPPPPPPKKKLSDDDAPAAEKHGVRSDEGTELRDEADHGKPHKRQRTAEEELAEPTKDAESLASVDEPGKGLSFQLMFGPMFLASPTGNVTTRFSFGLDFAWCVGRLIFSPEWEFLHKNFLLDVAWYYTQQGYGTQEVQVGSDYHFLSLALMFGVPVSDFFFYLKIGPAMMVMPVVYDVDGVQTKFSGVKAGLVYGVGAHMNLYVNDFLGVSARIEVLRFRRGYLDDTLLTFGLGLGF